jgi:hypothetical protein
LSQSSHTHFNSDKKLDLVVSSRTNQQLFLMLGEGNGSFEALSAIPSSPFDPVQALVVVVANINEDGKLMWRPAA